MKGWSELLLLAAVLTAAWTRTPIGLLAQGAWASWTGAPRPDLLLVLMADFRTEVPPSLEATMKAVAGRRPTPRSEGAWTTGLKVSVASQLGEDVLKQLLKLNSKSPQHALELRAIDPGVRVRAIHRARAAGVRHPRKLASYARFLPAADAQRAKSEVQDVLALATALELSWPVDPEARVTSGFGHRIHPVLQTRKLHEGIDIALPIGTPVHSAGGGRVTRARATPVSGKAVVIDHGHGVTTNYCHGDAVHVQPGEQVARGQLVMDSGNTGRSTGPHLHFGLRIHGRAVDPGVFHRPNEVAQRQPLDEQEDGADQAGE